MKKKLIVVAGPPACGKTYVSELIATSMDHIVYLDKDDLGDLIRASFSACGQELDMDGDFYGKNLRPAEYSTILNLAFSALQFADNVLLNAPFLREVRDLPYIQALKNRANQLDAALVLIWVTAPASVCYERMKMRNSDRDFRKLENWDTYIKKINDALPCELETAGAIDKLIPFDTKDDSTVQQSFAETQRFLSQG